MTDDRLQRVRCLAIIGKQLASGEAECRNVRGLARLSRISLSLNSDCSLLLNPDYDSLLRQCWFARRDLRGYRIAQIQDSPRIAVENFLPVGVR